MNDNETNDHGLSRREFVQGAVAGAVLAATPLVAFAADSDGDKAAVLAQIPKMHAQNLKRLQDWIALPSIAAEDRNYPQGAEHMKKLAEDAGFSGVTLIPTSGKPGVFGMLDAGAQISVAVYFMYDVKQFEPAEWSSPPLEAKLVEKPGLGTVCMGRGAVNQKGPQNSFLSALAAFKSAAKKLPINLVLVCEGEEEIGSPHFGEIVNSGDVLPHLKGCVGVMLADASQGLDGSVEVQAGAKGIVELELVSSGEKWGRGPKRDIHSSLEAQVDSPSWHLVQALNTLVEKDGHTPAVFGFFEKAKPLSERQKKMVEDFAASVKEATLKEEFGVDHWVHDESWQTSLLRLYSQPTINIEGLVGGYTGPGGKTILPHRAVAKIDMRLVPDMTAADTLAKLKAHLSKHGFGDVEVNMTGGYDPTQTDPDSKFFKAVVATFKKLGTTPQVLPRSPGSWPGYRFTSPPLSLAAGQFGLGHGTGAHAPDEYYLIDSKNPKIQGLDGAASSFVEWLYAMA
jgi:acetylornithine deacetylase/succinyl-diaminopimelate desuccinylase-like protein